jgi:hypothetical protein
VLSLSESQTHETISRTAAEGARRLAEAYDFGGLAKLKLSSDEARSRLLEAAYAGRRGSHAAEIWSALVSDIAMRANAGAVERTPFCLLDVAQTSFLKNLAEVCSLDVLPRRGDREKMFVESFGKALFAPWQRADDTPAFRWDPVEDSRHAYRWTAPGDEKQPVEHGANMLAAIGLPVITVVPAQRNGEVRLQVVGGATTSAGFVFAWPIWRGPASLNGIHALLSHPDLHTPGALAHFGVDSVRVTRRFNPPNSKYANFTPAVAL